LDYEILELTGIVESQEKAGENEMKEEEIFFMKSLRDVSVFMVTRALDLPLVFKRLVSS
jgi:hypothetical protein